MFLVYYMYVHMHVCPVVRILIHFVAYSSDEVSPDRTCAQLAVPGLNSTTPLYHQLQQYVQVKDDRTKSGGQKMREVSNRDLQRVLGEDPLPPLPPPAPSVADVASCQLSSVSTAATAPAVGPKSSEVLVL